MSLSLDMPVEGICVGGQTIRGVAELHFPQIVEAKVTEVHVKLRGTVQTKIDRPCGETSVRYQETIRVINENQSLWSKSSGYYPPAGSQVLRIPFEFTLPEDLPPSCSFDKLGRSAIVGYFVELVGTRPGVFSRNRRIRKPFPVVSKDLVGEEVARALTDPRNHHASNLSVQEKKIKRGFFGEYAHVRLELSFPDVPAYPLFTPIPYTLHIVTLTKPMKKEESEKHPDKANFPSPPIKPEDVEFRLRRKVWFKAQTETEKGHDVVTTLGGLEKCDIPSPHPVNVDVGERQWIPSDSEKSFGMWKKEVKFSSVFEFNCPPTFQTDIMTLDYMLELKVAFPGIGNDLEHKIPIVIRSGLTGAPPSYNPSDPNAPLALQVLDLPPSYWGGADDWDLGEKS